MQLHINLIILAIIQGITEWFPVSSSGHVVIFSKLLNFENNLMFDVALHLGTLMAVFVYFGGDIVHILEDILKLKWKSENAKLGYFIFIATLPAVAVGFLFRKFISNIFNNLVIVCICFGISGLILLLGSFVSFKKTKKIGFKESLLIGISQAFAILPGISRSGTTISSGLLLGLDEKKAVRFSFLMSIPVIFGAAILEIENKRLTSDLLWATILSFLVGLISIHFLLKIVINSKKNLKWFAFYLFILSILILIYLILSS